MAEKEEEKARERADRGYRLGGPEPVEVLGYEGRVGPVGSEKFQQAFGGIGHEGR